MTDDRLRTGGERSRPVRSPVVGRSAWAFAGQGISSASNLVLSLFVLANSDAAQFATFAICILSFQLFTQLCRSLFSLPLVILSSNQTPSRESMAAASPVIGMVVITGLVASGALAGATFATGISEYLALALVLPMLLYQDIVRHLAIAQARPKVAALSDGLWLLLQLSGCGLAVALDRRTPSAMILAWGSAGAMSGLLFGGVLGAKPTFAGISTWLRRHRDLWATHLAELVLISGGTYLVLYGLGVLAGAEELGRMRAAQTFLGPLTVALLGGAALGVPESVRLRSEPGRLGRFAVRLAGLLAVTSVLMGLAVYWLLPVIGPDLFPQTWMGARPLVPMLTVFGTALAINTGVASAVRASGLMPWIVRTRAATGGLAVALGWPGSHLFGANGAVAALAATELIFAVLACRRLQRVIVSGAEVAEGDPRP